MNKLFNVLCLISLLTFSFISCSDDDDFEKPELPAVITGVYILNSGSGSTSLANLAYYNPETKAVTTKVFENANGISLGSTGQDIIIYGSKMYIAVYGSGTIFVTDLKGKKIKSIDSEKNGQKQQPRRFTSYNGKVYVTYYDGYLAKIDTTKLEVESQVAVGRNPEYVRVANNNLYVANSGGMDYLNDQYDTTVSIVDISTFKESKKVEVVMNPEKIEVDSQGDIYVISNGNYGLITNVLQKIDATTNEVTKIGDATWMSMNNDKLYFIYSQYGKDDITYGVYDAKTEKIITKNFITDGTEVKKPYCINTDPINNNVYIGTSDYKSNGDMYIFSPEGKLIDKFDTGGVNPMGAYFVTGIK